MTLLFPFGSGGRRSDDSRVFGTGTVYVSDDSASIDMPDSSGAIHTSFNQGQVDMPDSSGETYVSNSTGKVEG